MVAFIRTENTIIQYKECKTSINQHKTNYSPKRYTVGLYNQHVNQTCEPRTASVCGPLPRELEQRRNSKGQYTNKTGQLPKHAGNCWRPPLFLTSSHFWERCSGTSLEKRLISFFFGDDWLDRLNGSGTDANPWNAMKWFCSLFFVCNLPEAIWDKFS